MRSGSVHVVTRPDSYDNDTQKSCDGGLGRDVIWRLSPVFPLSVVVPCAMGVGQGLVNPDSSPELTLTLSLLNQRLRILSVQTNAEDLMPASICEPLEEWRIAFYTEEKNKADQAAAEVLALVVDPPVRSRTSVRRKNPTKEVPSGPEDTSEEDIGAGGELAAANKKIRKMQSDLRGMCKKAKLKEAKANLKEANLLVQSLTTELSETQSRLVDVEQMNNSLTQKVSELTTAVIDLKSMLKSAKASSPAPPNPQSAATETDSKTQEPIHVTHRDNQNRSVLGHTHTMMALDMEQRKRRRREATILQQQRDLDDVHDALFLARWGGQL